MSKKNTHIKNQVITIIEDEDNIIKDEETEEQQLLITEEVTQLEIEAKCFLNKLPFILNENPGIVFCNGR